MSVVRSDYHPALRPVMTGQWFVQDLQCPDDGVGEVGEYKQEGFGKAIIVCNGGSPYKPWSNLSALNWPYSQKGNICYEIHGP